MTATSHSDERIAWTTAFELNLLLLVCVVTSTIAFPLASSAPLTTVRLVQGALSTVALIILLLTKRQPRLDLCLALFGLAALPQLAHCPIVAAARSAAGIDFEPLLRQKVLFLILGVISPRQSWIAKLVIVCFAIEVCFEYWVAGFGAAHITDAYEPWVTLSFAVCGIAVAHSRARLLTSECVLQQRLRETHDAATLAKMTLAIRDLANTPLQVIELQLTLLQERHPRLLNETAPIRRALDRLKSLNRTLSSHEAQRHSPTVDSAHSLASFDAAELLRRR